MKITLSITALILLFLTSCKKTSGNIPTTVNTISATVDGVNETFNVKLTASQSNIGGTNVLLITGLETSEANSAAINIEIDTTAAITEGTYPVKTGIPNGFNSGTSVSYVKGYEILYPSLNIASPSSITISHIDNVSVKGTFNATLSGSAPGLSPTTQTITDGKFDVVIKQLN